MNKQTFHYNLLEATKKLIVFTNSIYPDDYPNEFLYRICHFGQQSSDAVPKHLNALELKVTATWNERHNQLLTIEETIALLHHNNRVPKWINMYIAGFDHQTTTIELVCSRRLRAEAELMHPGLPPFHLQVMHH
jgi:hypothetical protein